METLKDILEKKKLELSQPKRKIKAGGNPNWNEAKQFGDYVGLPAPFILKLFRVYSKTKVLGLTSYLKDFPRDKRGLYGVIIWKLKGGVIK